MLHDFLEKNIQNELNILYALHSRSFASAKELSEILNLSISGTHTLIDVLNFEIRNLAKISKDLSGFSITYYENADIASLIHVVCQDSLVLHYLKFLITNDANKPFSDFINNQFLTKSSAYRLRKNCHTYLLSIGLDIDQNRISGEEYRIRFLISLLYYKYGIDCCHIDDDSIRITRRFILATNQVIDMKYLEQTANVYRYFECLFILSWKRKNHLVKIPEFENFNKLKEIFIYKKMKEVLKSFLEPTLNIRFSEEDYDYLYLVYCCTNSCMFADKWSQKDIDQTHDIVFSDCVFNDLMQKFEAKFGKEVQTSHSIRATFIYFYKKCLLELHCLIPDEHFYMESKHNHSTLIVHKLITDIINSWKASNHMKYEIDRSHLFYLSLQIDFILHQMIKPVSVFVLSDLNAELEVMTLCINKHFSSRRVVITPLLANAQDISFLYSKKDCIIIVSNKFKHIMNFSVFSGKNTVIPVTVEMNTLEIKTINNTLEYYEKKYFLDFIDTLS